MSTATTSGTVSLGAIIGGVVGVSVLVALIGLVTICVHLKISMKRTGKFTSVLGACKDITQTVHRGGSRNSEGGGGGGGGQ